MMTHFNKIIDLLSFGPSNEAIKFLHWRLKLKNYRGNHISQHNRLTFKKFRVLMISIISVQDDLGYIKIPRGDSGKDFRIGDYIQYDKLIRIFHEELEKQNLKPQGTANSIKKNLFPDLNRMNIINRFAKNGSEITPLPPYSIKPIDFISINSNLKVKENLQNDLFIKKIYEKQSKILYSNLLPLVNEILQNEKTKGYIDENEFLFFITWYQREYVNNIIFNVEIIIEMITSWRKLDRSVKEAVIKFIKDWAIPEKFTGNKTNKRDFHNWKNETQDIMQHFKDSNLFSLNQNASKFQLVFKEEYNKIKRIRSLNVKSEYIKNHCINKEKGFEFDHIVPFSWSTTVEEAIKIDNWKNLVYIDARNHAIKTCSNNKYVSLDKRNINNKEYIYLVADDQEFLALSLNKNIYFNMKLYNEIKNYNLSLHNLLNDYESQ